MKISDLKTIMPKLENIDIRDCKIQQTPSIFKKLSELCQKCKVSRMELRVHCDEMDIDEDISLDFEFHNLIKVLNENVQDFVKLLV